MSYEIKRLGYDGAVDADGHVLEPADMWERYVDPPYRDRAIRIGVDADGLEQLELDGRVSTRAVKGILGLMGAMGDPSARPAPDRRYAESMPYGASDPNERLALLDKEHLEGALLYPTIGLLWECELTDPGLTLALQRAYNRWIADFCRDSGGRLVPIAHLTLLDPDGSARELERAVADGCRGGFVAPFSHTRKAHGHPDHDPLWAAACDLGVPMAVHPTWEPVSAMPVRFDGMGRRSEFFYNVMVRQGVQQAFLSFLAYGTLDRFPSLQLGILESGSGWVGSFLDRADAVAATGSGAGIRLEHRPSEYFARQCFVSGDPDETAAALLFDHVGADRFMWATDYPHPDHDGSWVDALSRLVSGLSPETRARVLGSNVVDIYGLTQLRARL